MFLSCLIFFRASAAAPLCISQDPLAEDRTSTHVSRHRKPPPGGAAIEPHPFSLHVQHLHRGPCCPWIVSVTVRRSPPRHPSTPLFPIGHRIIPPVRPRPLFRGGGGGGVGHRGAEEAMVEARTTMFLQLHDLVRGGPLPTALLACTNNELEPLVRGGGSGGVVIGETDRLSHQQAVFSLLVPSNEQLTQKTTDQKKCGGFRAPPLPPTTIAAEHDEAKIPRHSKNSHPHDTPKSSRAKQSLDVSRRNKNFLVSRRRTSCQQKFSRFSTPHFVPRPRSKQHEDEAQPGLPVRWKAPRRVPPPPRRATHHKPQPPQQDQNTRATTAARVGLADALVIRRTIALAAAVDSERHHCRRPPAPARGSTAGCTPTGAAVAGAHGRILVKCRLPRLLRWIRGRRLPRLLRWMGDPGWEENSLDTLTTMSLTERPLQKKLLFAQCRTATTITSWGLMLCGMMS